MNLKCPRCDDVDLAPTQAAPGLTARACEHCHGLLLDLFSYRQWRESYQQSEGAPHQFASAEVDESGDSHQALLCTKCRRLMTKYRVTGDQDNRLDFCVHCSEVWLDSGELALLNAPKLGGDLAKVFTRPWQNSIVQNRTQQMQHDRLEKILGTELADVDTFARWLHNNAEKDQILAYLQHAPTE